MLNSDTSMTYNTLVELLTIKFAQLSAIMMNELKFRPSKFIITNTFLGSILATYLFKPNNTSKNISLSKGIYTIGTFDNTVIYVDPFMKFDYKRILVGSICTNEQYHIANLLGINVNPRYKTLLRNNFINTDENYLPYKSFMTIIVKDTNNILF
jgi:hypothetical protein